MSIPSPAHDSNRDPFQLDRLAEELVSRESTLLTQSSWHLPEDDDRRDLELPPYIPLSHDNPFLTAETFNVEEFLLSRSHTSLPDLRSELRDYLSTLKEELVKLINDDYEAFISLSTDLRGEGVRLNRLKLPLGDLKSQILVCPNVFLPRYVPCGIMTHVLSTGIKTRAAHHSGYYTREVKEKGDLARRESMCTDFTSIQNLKKTFRPCFIYSLKSLNL
jgi:hypothetical protein